MNPIQSTLHHLISFPTITSDVKTNDQALRWCQKFLADNNIKSRLEEISGRPLLHWGSPPQKAEIMINSHLDVVPGSTAIFRPKTIGSRLFGRGAADTKAAVATLISLDPQFIKLATRKKILFSLVCDEETGGSSTKEFISHIPRLKFALFGEPTNLKIVNQAKGIMQVRITASGVAAHGSRPWQGKNAIELLTSQLSNFLKSHPTPTRETKNATFNFSLISGGSAINQVPDSCQILIDIRFHPQDRPRDILKNLKSFFPQCKIVPLKIESPIFCDPDHPLSQLLRKCLRSTRTKAEFAFEHGSSDARHCTTQKIPALVFGPIGENLHQEKEWVNIESLPKFQKVLESFILSC